MTPLLGLLLLVVVVGGIGLLTVAAIRWTGRLGEQRAAQLLSFGSPLGFEAVEGAPPRPDGPAQDAPFADLGAHGPHALLHRPHLLRRSGARLLRIGDRPQLANPKYRLTLASLEDPGLDLPLFTVRPRAAFGSRSKQAVGIPEDPAFEMAFGAYGPDATAVRALLTPAVRAVLLERGGHLSWEGFARTLGVTPGLLADEAGQVQALVAALEAVTEAMQRSRG